MRATNRPVRLPMILNIGCGGSQFAPDALELQVDDDGAGSGGETAGGNGLVGMRERAALFGGELEAGRRNEGGFRVRALLPLRAST